MKRPDLRKLAADPRFISGIYNYCDRWCERCPLSHRCLNYAMEQQWEEKAAKARDVDNQGFWDELHDIFQTTLEMIREEAQKRGVNLDDPQLEANAKAHDRQVRRRAARNKPLAQESLKYSAAVANWLKKADALFRAKGVELATKARLEIGQPEDEADELRGAIEVIQWYQVFIHMKLTRAIGSQVEEEMETDPEMRAFPKSSDGSAKIALIAIDRSLAAWTQLSREFPEETDAILDFQVNLARLRSVAQNLFPNARAFVRPGFDTAD